MFPIGALALPGTGNEMHLVGLAFHGLPQQGGARRLFPSHPLKLLQVGTGPFLAFDVSLCSRACVSSSMTREQHFIIFSSSPAPLSVLTKSAVVL